MFIQYEDLVIHSVHEFFTFLVEAMANIVDYMEDREHGHLDAGHANDVEDQILQAIQILKIAVHLAKEFDFPGGELRH